MYYLPAKPEDMKRDPSLDVMQKVGAAIIHDKKVFHFQRRKGTLPSNTTPGKWDRTRLKKHSRKRCKRWKQRIASNGQACTVARK